MRTFCWLAFGAALTMPIQVQAADPVQIQVNPVQIQLQPFGRAGGPLLTPEAVDKLKLSAEQKEKYAKVDEEYKDKQKAAGEKLREAIQSQDRTKIQEARVVSPITSVALPMPSRMLFSTDCNSAGNRITVA